MSNKNKSSKGKKPTTPRRYDKRRKKSSNIEGQITLAELGFFSDQKIRLEKPDPVPPTEEKYPCNAALARQYWYKIKIVVEKSAHVATKYGIWKYIKKVGDLNILRNEFLYETDINAQRKRQERIEKLEEKYALIREKWINDDTKKGYLKYAEEEGITVKEDEIDEFKLLEYLIKKENESIKEALSASNVLASEIKREIPDFKIVKMDSKEDIERVVKAFVTVPKFRGFVKNKYLGPALATIDKKGFSMPISLIEISDAYRAKKS